MNRKNIRIGMAIGTAVLFAAEFYIGIFQHDNWIRSYLGDVLVIMLLYCLVRIFQPTKPKYGWILPTALLAFSFMVEFLQKWGFVNKFHITNQLLRILIGTSFAWEDLLSYFIGFLPLLLFELCMRKRMQKPQQSTN